MKPICFFRNFTGFKLLCKIGNFSYSFSAGIIEEIVWNATECPDASAQIESLISKEQMIRGGSLAVTTHILEKSAGFVGVIASATPNLYI